MIVLRSLVFRLWLFGGSAIMAIVCIPVLVMPRSVVAALMRLWGRFVCVGLKWICGIRIEVRGTAPDGAALIAAKHQGMFDVCGPFAFLPDACFVMKKELLNIPLFGWYAMRGRMVWVDRDAHSTALRKMVTDVRDRMDGDRQLIIFPEGTRKAPGDAPDYKPGIAALYRDLDLLVIPCATNSGVHWPAKGFMRYPGVVVFEYLDPIPAGLKRGEFMRELEARIEAATGRLIAEGL